MSRYLCNINDWRSSDDDKDEEITTHEQIVFAAKCIAVDIELIKKKDKDKDEDGEPPSYSKMIVYRFFRERNDYRTISLCDCNRPIIIFYRKATEVLQE